METGEYRGFAGQFPQRLRHLAVIWRWPLLLSLLLHAFAFWPAIMREAPAGSASQDLRAHLRRAVAQPAPAADIAAAPRVQDSRPVPIRPAVAGRPPAGGSTSAPEVAASHPAVMQGTLGLDAGAVRGYRIALTRLLAAGPLRAELGPQMHGELEIGIAVTAGGLVERVGLVRGSGDAVLDARVLAAVRTATGAAMAPAELHGSVVVLPVEVTSATAAGR